jgi:site-specific recombinase XerD
VSKLALAESIRSEPEVKARALLALLLACGLRRHELADLTFGHLQQRERH